MRAPIEAFFKAFDARDNEAVRKTLHYPHVRINEAGGVTVFRDASEAGTNLDALTPLQGRRRQVRDTYQSRWIVTKKDGRRGASARAERLRSSG